MGTTGYYLNNGLDSQLTVVRIGRMGSPDALTLAARNASRPSTSFELVYDSMFNLELDLNVDSFQGRYNPHDDALENR